MIKFLITVICIFSFLTHVQADFFRVSGKQILDNDGNPIVLRGVGLGGWLVPEGYMLHTPGFGSPTSIRNQFIDLIGLENTEAFFDLYRANYVNEDDIKAIAKIGYNSIRLPFHYSLFYNNQQGGFDENGFQLLDEFLNWCRAENLYVILDMHCAPGGQSKDNIADGDGVLARLWTNSANQDLTIEIWTEIARRYADEELIIGYDLLNEPVLPDGYSNSILRGLYVRIISSMRTVDPNHIVFIEGNWYATDFTSLTPPMDPNMVYSFHKYWNETTKATIQQYINMRNEFNVPLWLGESGENSNTWFYETTKLMEDNDIGWNWWTHKKIETITSPYSASIGDNYQKVLDYLNGEGDKPSVEFSKQALFEMAENLALDKCTYHPDVVSALFDPEYNFAEKPYKQHKIPGIIQAVDYDIGNQLIAYTDTDYKRTRWDEWQPWNNGGVYRNDGVDIELSQDSRSKGYDVGWIANGEWLKYTVTVAVDGQYDIEIGVASTSELGRIRLLLDGKMLGQDITIPNTEGWQNWQSVLLSGIDLARGTYELKIEFINGGFNFSHIAFHLRSSKHYDVIGKEGYLGQNFPNPFNNKTLIPLILNTQSKVNVAIYDVNGHLVRTLRDSMSEAGLLELTWDGTNDSGVSVATGPYFYTVLIGSAQKSKKMLFLR